MEELTQAEIKTYYAQRVPGIKKSGRSFRAPCPVHKGKNLNFAIDVATGLCCCHSSCGRGWDAFGLEQEISGVEFPRAKEIVYELIGRGKPTPYERRTVASYTYQDANGEPIYRITRPWTKPGEKKRFVQEHVEPDGEWISNLEGVVPVPFQLPKVIESEFVCVVEGEKDAVNLTNAGIVSTCNNGGANNFKAELALWFKGKAVGIIPDNDEAGRKHAISVAGLLKRHAKAVRIIELPNSPLKGDVTDFLQMGGTAEEIRQLFEAAPDWSSSWTFSTDVPDDNDKYVRTPLQFLNEVGGMEGFWSQELQHGTSTPWKALDRKLGGGMRPAEVYVIGANQGQGKSSLALQFAIHALKEKRGVLLFSMEMSWRDVFQRMVAMEAKVDLNQYRALQRGSANSDEYKSLRADLHRETGNLADFRLYVSNKTRVTPDYLLKESERIGMKSRISLIIVDHMQLMSASGTAKGDYEKFTAISRATKEVSMCLKVPLLLVSQTSRNSAHDKRVKLEVSDLRGSGAIEEDAAAIMLLYDDKEDSEQCRIHMTYDTGPVKTWLELGKNRFGPSGCAMPLLHHKTTTQFEYQEYLKS